MAVAQVQESKRGRPGPRGDVSPSSARMSLSAFASVPKLNQFGVLFVQRGLCIEQLCKLSAAHAIATIHRRDDHLRQDLLVFSFTASDRWRKDTAHRLAPSQVVAVVSGAGCPLARALHRNAPLARERPACPARAAPVQRHHQRQPFDRSRSLPQLDHQHRIIDGRGLARMGFGSGFGGATGMQKADCALLLRTKTRQRQNRRFGA